MPIRNARSGLKPPRHLSEASRCERNQAESRARHELPIRAQACRVAFASLRRLLHRHHYAPYRYAQDDDLGAAERCRCGLRQLP